METNNQTINTKGRGPVNGHYPTLIHALAVAMPKCIVWRETEEGTPITAKDLYEFAKKHDEEHPLNPEQFYMVSREGAIGLSPGLEWLTKWMFIPMEPTQERDFHIYMMQEELQMEAAAEKAVEEAVTKGLAAEKAAKEAAAKAAAVVPPPIPPTATTASVPPAPPSISEAQAMNFCPFCGTKLPAGSKFCSNCGKNIKNI